MICSGWIPRISVCLLHWRSSVQALLNSRPLPSCFYNYSPPFLSWMTCLCAFDGWGSPLHPRCGLESRDGSCHYASHLFGRCSGNVSFQTGCLCRRTLCWTPAWNRGSLANVERACWRGRLGNPCNSPWRDSRSLSGHQELTNSSTWRRGESPWTWKWILI